MSTGREYDEITPHDHGLVSGWDWAKAMHRSAEVWAEEAQTVENVKPVLEAEARDIDTSLAGTSLGDLARVGKIPGPLRDRVLGAGMAERLAASEDPDAEAAFWNGFALGVVGYLFKVGKEAGPN